MWIELALASGAISAVCGSILAINKIFPAETKRFLRIVQAEITARIPNKPKRPTVEVALAAGSDVSMKWWDEEFAKAERAIPTASWAQQVSGAIKNVSVPTMSEISLENLRRWSAGGVVEVTQGDFTFNVRGMLNSLAVLSEGEAVLKLKNDMVEFERAKLDNVRRNPHHSDATPPGKQISLREAEESGVSLQAAQKECLRCFAADSRLKNVPQQISVKMRESIDVSSSYNSLIAAVAWGKLMLEKHGYVAGEECEFCEYEEVKTYASSNVKRYKTSPCWECQSDKDERLEKVDALSTQAIMTLRGI